MPYTHGMKVLPQKTLPKQNLKTQKVPDTIAQGEQMDKKVSATVRQTIL
jgi:hypothetical protein